MPPISVKRTSENAIRMPIHKVRGSPSSSGACCPGVRTKGENVSAESAITMPQQYFHKLFLVTNEL